MIQFPTPNYFRTICFLIVLTKSPTSNHFHPLQAWYYNNNSRLVADIINGKFRIGSINEYKIIHNLVTHIQYFDGKFKLEIVKQQ